MFETISYLKSGTTVQRKAFEAISELGILKDLDKYSPLLCGTVPLAIDIPGSDLDIAVEVYDFISFQDEVTLLYGDLHGFALTELTVKGVPTLLCNFHFHGFDFELFAQPKPAKQQNAYRHMLVEHHLLLGDPHLRELIIRLKESGMKTEPAFARVLGLTGDPYDELLILGSKLGVID